MNASWMVTTGGPPDRAPFAGWIQPMGKLKPGPRQKSDLKRLWGLGNDQRQGKNNIDNHRCVHINSNFTYFDRFYLLGLEG